MNIVGYELDNFIPSKWELEPFDLKLINNLSKNHPFQKTMFITYKYYPNYQMGGDDEDGVDYYGTGLENDVVKAVNYFKLLNDFYRYGITFQKEYEIYPENVLCVKSCYDEDEPFHYIIDNNYDLKTSIFNDVKKINLNNCDTGEINLSEIEKWKRKVINEQQNKKTKLRLLNPTIYRRLITFYIFFNFKDDQTISLIMISYKGIDKIFRKIKNYKYEHIKNYEDKISKKVFSLSSLK